MIKRDTGFKHTDSKPSRDFRASGQPDLPGDLVEGADGIDATWVKLHRRGKVGLTSYLGLGTVAVAVGVASHLGPLGWLAQLELGALGREFPVVTGIVAYAVLSLPIIIIANMPKNPARPLLFGAQDAINPNRSPRFIPRPIADVRGRIRKAFRIGLGLMAFAVMGGAGCWFASQQPSPDAGQPLPELTRAQIVSTSGALPGFARVTDVSDHQEAAWSHNWTARYVHYRDVYIPLTGPGWKPRDPVDLVELDQLLPDDPPTPSNELDPTGPKEGTLSRDGIESWLGKAMRADGFALAPHAVLLTRKPLDGKIPGPDIVDGIIWLVFAFTLFFISGIATLKFWLMLREMDRKVAE